MSNQYPAEHKASRKDSPVHAEYCIWKTMRQRCFNPKCRVYRHYGGRGITVDPKWNSFEQFIKDLGPRPSPNHSIDRVDNEGHYSPTNCRWATQVEQRRNSRQNKLIAFAGKFQSLTDWSKEIGIPYTVLSSRLHLGWTIERALTTVVHSHHKEK